MAPQRGERSSPTHHLGQVEAVGLEGGGALDRAQLPAPGRGKVLEAAPQLVQLPAGLPPLVGTEPAQAAVGAGQGRALPEDGRFDLVQLGRGRPHR